MAEEGERMANMWGDMPEDEYYASKGVKNAREEYESPQGKLFTQSWLPAGDQPPKGLVCCTHGYGADSGWTFELLPMALAQRGYAAFAADMPGFGRSWGMPGLVENMDASSASLASFYDSVRHRPAFRSLPAFLFGESMGGAIALLIHLHSSSDEQGWAGLILSAPLIGIGTAMAVPEALLASFKKLSPLAAQGQFVPDGPVAPNVFRDVARRDLIFQNPRRYVGAPRAQTRLEMERICDFLQQNMAKVSVPFLVLHGTDDNVTDPNLSQKLHDTAASHDKSIKLYEGAFHSLLQGELEHVRAQVLDDITAWLDARSSS
ncbi:acylglycerol lipase [Marchantia polymorpha subsp. ruderalis]|uniref:Serine aminopeptidase S33 domain-containing protein n=2 Tax=Marchantia polymorpha TaxID=3197 RepID=A0AAF6BHZ7_MARPO|nr:hypothetical protein MARPO_0032s0047 [Marchantia polymorpha]BBN11631.1 hypothetical protein Mp_5g13540 [Marchantia polymorpha subsp. ruderalis]|eukprot:PTQ41845.1 hypothetical protein MARPO_0032s0047 [Marchantia polymorpha]